MGLPMCSNLLKAGFPVFTYDLNSSAVKTAVERGAKQAASPKEAASHADVVVTMLPSSPHVKSVYTGPTGILSAAKKGMLFLDCSTIDPGVAREVAEGAAAVGASMLDSPVSGGVMGAANGTLTFMVGGPAADFERAKAVLSAMGRNIVHCGASGTGQTAKICNNLILGISMAGVAEAFNLGRNLGIDPKVLAGIVNTSSGRCWASDTSNPCPGVMENVPASRGYSGGFGCELMAKDLGLAAQAAAATGSNLPVGMLTHQLYQIMSKTHAGKDFGAMFEFLQSKEKK